MKKLIILLGLICVFLPRVVAPSSIKANHPKSIKEIIYEAADRHNVPKKVLAGICYVESNFKPHAMNHNDGNSGSYGLCQIKLAVARNLGFSGSRRNLMHPEVNAFFAAKLFRYHMDRNGNNIAKSIRAYNVGFFDGHFTSKYHRMVYEAMKNL